MFVVAETEPCKILNFVTSGKKNVYGCTFLPDSWGTIFYSVVKGAVSVFKLIGNLAFVYLFVHIY